MKTITETNRLSFLYATKLDRSIKAGDVVVVRLRADQKTDLGFVRDGKAYGNIKTARRYRERRPASARMFEIMGRIGNTWAAQEIA